MRPAAPGERPFGRPAHSRSPSRATGSAGTGPGSPDACQLSHGAPPGADASAEKSARKKIDEAERRILAGEDFGKVAREVSDDMSKAN
ncbi:MAG: peptidylprolyl isomerase, partial [Betaproteobacteria bacterium]